MKFITLKTSTTGKKLQAIENSMNQSLASQKAMAKKYKIKKWRNAYWGIAGRFSAVMFEDNVVVDKKVWKNVNGSKNEWMPRLNNSDGKLIQKDFDTMPKVTGEELNEAVGFDGDIFKTIGFNMKHKKYFGFQLHDEWDYKSPKDCKETTVTEYNKLFLKK